ncbi:MAG: MotA/TolQ/ExbB proton channel family protein, partial [Candidatus Cloacimonetes bacterium]|nr:MotA/TolQ/ExbB proton channel family protein [Candidatus Cloacimonadota bacterium]
AELALSKEVYRLEKNLGVLATFAAVAPLIGFLGTVTGMVKVFMRIGETGGGVDISLLANGIWEALVTTIGGLTVGIISILFYNYLVGKVEDIAQELEEKTNEFIFNIRGIRDEN